MLFHDPLFLLVFLPLVLFSYFFILKNKKFSRVYLLVFASFVFYAAWNINLSPLIIITILINYLFGKKISDAQDSLKKKRFLFSAILFNILFLGFFKYSDFVIFNINSVFDSDIELLNFPFPLALSFVTFQTIAYLVDCYDGNISKTDLKKYALFISFFPQLIAGPIVRYNYMISQFEDEKNDTLNYKNIYIGLIVIAIGLMKKLLIADNLSIVVDQGFNAEYQLTFLEGWLTSLGFVFQIYFDFSGYIDMATGIALLFNINLPANFNSPFKATGMINFWQRWHITLSRFLKDYIYIPLGGNKKGNFRTLNNLMATFIIGGIWHGAGWTFVFWGFLHGLALVVHRIWYQLGFRFNLIIGWIITFNFINIAWVFFRAKELEDAIKVLKGMFGLSGIEIHPLFQIPLNIIKFIKIEYNTMWLKSIEGNNYNTPLMILIGFILVLIFSNSVEKMNKFKPTKFNILYTFVLLWFSLSSLITINSEFLYFNF